MIVLVFILKKMCNPNREYLERLSKEIEYERDRSEILEKELELSKLKLKNRKISKEIRDNDKDD
jgi:hypothetical protein